MFRIGTGCLRGDGCATQLQVAPLMPQWDSRVIPQCGNKGMTSCLNSLRNWTKPSSETNFHCMVKWHHTNWSVFIDSDPKCDISPPTCNSNSINWILTKLQITELRLRWIDSETRRVVKLQMAFHDLPCHPRRYMYCWEPRMGFFRGLAHCWCLIKVLVSIHVICGSKICYWLWGMSLN